MSIPKEQNIPGQPAAGQATEPGQPLEDGALDDVTGGCGIGGDIDDDDMGVDLDMVEGSIRLKPGSDTPIVDK